MITWAEEHPTGAIGAGARARVPSEAEKAVTEALPNAHIVVMLRQGQVAVATGAVLVTTEVIRFVEGS